MPTKNLIKRAATDPGNSPGDLSNQIERRMIGAIGLVLPLVVYVLAAVDPVVPSMRWQLLESISAYYYTAGVGLFVGLLVALAIFLMSYQGYEGKMHTWDLTFAKIASVAALCVAFFPTGKPEAYPPAPLWWQDWMAAAHAVSAIVLFLCFAAFALLLFPRTAVKGRESPEKKKRNAIYYVCGSVIILAEIAVLLVWLLARRAGSPRPPIAIEEIVALVAFAVSWLAKGNVIFPDRARVGPDTAEAAPSSAAPSAAPDGSGAEQLETTGALS